ncbi:hypothetical protein N2152v2_002880 [Parachlorella kessleri]
MDPEAPTQHVAQHLHQGQRSSCRRYGAPVVLRVEMVTRRQALILLWTLWAMLAGFIGFLVALLVLQDDLHSSSGGPRHDAYYGTVLALACMCLAAVLACGMTLYVRCYQMRRQHRQWSSRQKVLAADAAVMLGCQVLMSAFWMGAYAAIMDSDCLWPAKTVALLSCLKWTALNSALLWMLVMIHGMCVQPAVKRLLVQRQPASDGSTGSPATVANSSAARQQPAAAKPPREGLKGLLSSRSFSEPKLSLKGASDGEDEEFPDGPPPAEAFAEHASVSPGLIPELPHTDRLLILDLPARKQFKMHAPKLLIWAVLEAAIIMAVWRQFNGGRITVTLLDGCDSAQGDNCSLGGREIAALFIETILLLVYAVLCLRYQICAHADHSRFLPYARYRLSNIYIRVQARYLNVVLAAICLQAVLLLIIGYNSCWAYLHTQLGFPPVEIALAVMALIKGFLYMPASRLQAPILLAWLQEFAWTLAALPGLKALRDAELQQTMAEEPTLDELVLPSLLPGVVPDRAEAAADAAEQLRREPMFCMELALRCFYWTRLAKLCGVPHSTVTEEAALGLFGLQQCECFKEPSTDTKAVLGWGGAGAPYVLAFKGTSSGKNALHDLQAGPQVPYSITCIPLVAADEMPAGFFKSFTAHDFGERMLSKVGGLLEASQADTSQLTFYLTGHSLGGAVAMLAAYEVHKRWPASRIVVYTFGAPRVGNLAWANVYSEAVPETWAVVNHQDPVPRVPKFYYYPSGHRVSMGLAGDIIIRPSYFESSVINRQGGSLFHHRNGAYAMSFAAVLKAQFDRSKALPGGAEGVLQLASCIDIGAALLLGKMDTANLRDPKVRPIILAALERVQDPRQPGWQVARKALKQLAVVQKIVPKHQGRQNGARQGTTEAAEAPEMELTEEAAQGGRPGSIEGQNLVLKGGTPRGLQ